MYLVLAEHSCPEGLSFIQASNPTTFTCNTWLMCYINRAGSKVGWTETDCLPFGKFVAEDPVVGRELFSYPV